MLRKGQREDWFKPLLEHANCHAVSTTLIALVYCLMTNASLGLVFVAMLLDLVVHFTVDRIKAHPDLGGRFKMDNPKFWWCLGADQMCHHLTHYFIIYLLVS